MRPLTQIEKSRLKTLTQKSISLTLIQPTETGLKKSIMDATGPVRVYLKENHIHDYNLQHQGPEHKIIMNCLLYESFSTFKTRISLYKPITKKGDPRIWISGLTKHSNPDDIIAIIFYDGIFHAFNLTQIKVNHLIDSKISNPLQELINEINQSQSLVAQELLLKLRNIAKSGPFPSLVDADTSVGRTLETALGIDINSSKKPDYKGIELKSFRSRRANRKNLFAQVPDWNLSKFKSSAEILNEFGYHRGEDFKLYCTVSTLSRNSQGLMLNLNTDINHLIENSDKPKVGDFVIWTLEKLHERLSEKHKETFWVEADSQILNGKEYFQYTLVEHTKKPILSQFDLLIDQGYITLDHLIKRDKEGKVVEKGPLFKIKPSGINLLFPPSNKYNLLNI
ncbi:MAG: hypothetical protein K9J13_14140 [Saprospiraceae bacterium]|nr:hypothetical protein [Saprospiraceae bacterium]